LLIYNYRMVLILYHKVLDNSTLLSMNQFDINLYYYFVSCAMIENLYQKKIGIVKQNNTC